MVIPFPWGRDARINGLITGGNLRADMKRGEIV